eukprot:scaffold6491_cov49-Cylindrotheca_fusiformis.AAC.3
MDDSRFGSKTAKETICATDWTGLKSAFHPNVRRKREKNGLSPRFGSKKDVWKLWKKSEAEKDNLI